MIRSQFEPTFLESLGNNIEWTQIECGAFYPAAVTKEGALLTWGYNGCGQLGHGDRVDRVTPTRVAELDGLVVISQVACGRYHMTAQTDKGKLLTTW